MAFCFMCFVNYSPAQTIKFNHTYGDMPYNYGRRIIETNDKGFMMLGNVSSVEGNSNIVLIRIDSTGVIIFQKTLGDQLLYWANDFIRTSDKGYLIAGLTLINPEKGYDMLLIKTDSNANMIWEKSFGGEGWDIANAVKETKDNAYLIAGQTYSFGAANENMYVIKTNTDGDTIWTKTFGGDSTDYATSLEIMYDSTYLIAGATNSFGFGNFDGYVLNLDKNGDTIWTKTYGEDNEDIIYSIKQTPDSGYVFAGYTKSYGADLPTTWLMKYDKNESLMWKMPEPWDINGIERVFYNVNLDDSANFLLTGYAIYSGKKDLIFYKFNRYWNFICSFTRGSIKDTEGFQAIQTGDKGYVMVGSLEGQGLGVSNIYVTKIGNDCSFSNTDEHILSVKAPSNYKQTYIARLFPTVSEGKYCVSFNEISNITYKVAVYNLLGQEILKDHFTPSDGSLYFFDISNNTDGAYFVEISNSVNRGNFKIMKICK